ncbi:putative ABC transporter ATP-binding protein [Candidatus Anstonella stagnisolia]|nr:putative ABC transporter ATP-binding protein [Candidatus Anstonella stagnisolia]
MQKKETIALEAVSKTYSQGAVAVHALGSISFKVHEGERVSIIGPSGCGKSTLLHILGLLDVPTGGKLFLDGTDVSTLDEQQLAHFRGRKIGFIFQSFFLIPTMDALSNVALPMMFYDVPEHARLHKAQLMLERLGMGDRLHHLPSELSGGQRQRVAIARALVNDPSVLLADEPTGNLDSRSGEEVLKIFDELSREGKTIIIVTHDPNIAKMSPRIIRLKDGNIESDEKKR